MNISRRLFSVVVIVAMTILMAGLAHAAGPDTVLSSFLDRIGGPGASDRILTVVDEDLSDNGNDVFIVTAADGKPMVKGSSVIAVTTGINHYLNHVANINLSWNRLTTDLSAVDLPLPDAEIRRECRADYRYYLNYCTFSYSMSTWTWDRWQKEIDWMALHGINMPLQIVGLDVVWRDLLTEYYGYSRDEANAFIAGPCFQAWWGMNNLESWGGPNPDWWYERQANLARQICQRERELGMQPVLPGFCGMVPSDFTDKTGIPANDQGLWCAFTRPRILDPNNSKFPEVADRYYDVLHKVMGKSDYYSLDPFHEGANTNGIDVPAAYSALYKAMDDANPGSKWVIQQWQWSKPQYNVLERVPKGKLVVLDLFSDAQPRFETYDGHDAVYCSLPNFGGRTGMMGRLNGVVEGYNAYSSEYPNLKGVGATPEAIGQVPVLYDILFELPWMDDYPDPAQWVEDYTKARYGVDNDKAKQAWEKLRTTVLDCRSRLQGPHEAVICARPSLTVDYVSSWGGTDIFYDPQAVVDAAYAMLESGLDGDNYRFDMIDITRQALTDYAKSLLAEIKVAHEHGGTSAPGFDSLKTRYLELILDIDQLLCSDPNYMLGQWTEMARDIADEIPGTDDADRDWLELDNARTLITTWGARTNADNGGLRDYSYRESGGILRDFYYGRWKKWFDECMPDDIECYAREHAWATDGSKRYYVEPHGDPVEIAGRLLHKYLPR